RAGARARSQLREPAGESDTVPRARLMDFFVIHLLNSLLYASVLFLIAGGLSLIYGVMRIVNLAHGNLYAFGAYTTAWAVCMAATLGVNVNRTYVHAFTIGCFMAGLGGAIIVPSQSAVLGMGVDALVLSFIVVVIGGLGSLEGALVGALIVGFVREAGITYFP